LSIVSVLQITSNQSRSNFAEKIFRIPVLQYLYLFWYFRTPGLRR